MVEGAIINANTGIKCIIRISELRTLNDDKGLTDAIGAPWLVIEYRKRE
jgi:hypothetical protein